jgi:ribonuclease HIII
MPEAYNAAWEEVGNVNVLLGRLHAEVLTEVLAKAKVTAGCRIVVDKFGDPSHVRKRLPPAVLKLEFAMITGGEREPAVAAASFLARAAFLRGFAEIQADAPMPLPLGASDPRIHGAVRALAREGGEAWLGKFAKLHFKTIAQALGRS